MSPSCGKLHFYKLSDSSARTGNQSPSVSDPCVLSLGTWETTETWASDILLKYTIGLTSKYYKIVPRIPSQHYLNEVGKWGKILYTEYLVGIRHSTYFIHQRHFCFMVTVVDTKLCNWDLWREPCLSVFTHIHKGKYI